MENQCPKQERAMSTNELVSIIVPFRNEERSIEYCVLSIINQDYPGSLEILAVDDGSTDKSVEILGTLMRSHHSIRLIRGASRGEAEARNAGISVSSGRIIIHFSAHAIAVHNFVSTLVSKLIASSADVAAVGCKHMAFDTSEPSMAFGLAIRSTFGAYGTTYHQPKTEQFVESAAFCAWRAEVLTSVGPFDPAMGEGVDAELNLRLAKAGYKLLYTPETIVYHSEVASAGLFWAKMMGYGAGRAKIIIKHPSSFRLLYALPSIALLVPAFLAVGTIFYRGLVFVLLSVVLAYVSCSLIEGVIITRRTGMRRLMRVMLAFPLIHLGYGVGFVKELVWSSLHVLISRS
jgi:cellulose synthase/poly-beta-1,6-N-acetylglucosamine synthase-like glycosyltransferase